MSNLIKFPKRHPSDKFVRRPEALPHGDELAQRMQRIMTSLEKINTLMQELKPNEKPS